MQDSLTGQPVSQGWAVLESGTQLFTTPIFNFSQSQKVAGDAHGSFSLCSPALTQPSVIVLAALDASGKAYPAFVAAVSGAADLGIIHMGGFQQASAPATIQGTITSAPLAKTGSVVAQFATMPLDGSKNIWNLAVPILDPAQSNTFTTTAGVCAGNAPFCAAYTFTLPSQNPIQRINGGTLQQVGAPVYSLYAVPDGAASCSPSFAYIFFQQDGKSFLTGTPGARLTAADIAFAGCQ